MSSNIDSDKIMIDSPRMGMEAGNAGETMTTQMVSKYSDARLYKFNMIAAILHGVQFLIQFVGAFVAPGVKDFTLPLTLTYQVFDQNTTSLSNEVSIIANYRIGIIVPFFLLMSSVAHIIVLVNFKTYIAQIDSEINRFRWYEYAASSSLMIWCIAAFFGVYDLATLLLIFATNASMNLFGLHMEELNQLRSPTKSWAPFVHGCWAGIFPWIVIMMYFVGSGEAADIPGFVYGILVSYFVFFNLFPINMVLQYVKYGPWKDYRYGEFIYIILSLLAKTLLSWLVFGGTFQPSSDA